MTTKEIKERIEQIKERLFMLNMIDRQTSEDRERISNLKNELNEMEMALAQNKRKEVKKMTVKELIKELEQYDGDMEVKVTDDNQDEDLNDVDSYDGYVVVRSI